MSSFLEQYSAHFFIGMTVVVRIPLENAEVFRDWAVIHELDEDFISLQLSRDQLPLSLKLYVGQIVEIRGGRDDSGFSCRAIIVLESEERTLLMRLIGDVVSDELREFYRIDAFLPIKYYLLQDQNATHLRKEWEQRQQARQVEALNRNHSQWSGLQAPDSATLPSEPRHTADDGAADDWDSIIPLAANVSGGGLRTFIHQEVQQGEYLLLQMLVPEPRRIIDTVARVVFTRPLSDKLSSTPLFSTGLQFVFIDERDRDAIVNHVSSIQLMRIRMLRESFIYRNKEGADSERKKVRRFWRQLITGGVLLVILALLVVYFRNYAVDKPKNEIELIFENSLRKYIQKFK